MTKPEAMTLRAPIGQLSADTTDTAKRTITGYAYTCDVDWEYGDQKYRFAAESVTPWRDHVPLYAYHDATQVVGRMIRSEWQEPAWAVELKLANTPRADEMLALAADQAIGGLSMYITDVQLADEPTESGAWLITSAACAEISMVGHPAVPTAVLTGVALSATPEKKEITMGDSPNTAVAEMDLSAPQGPSIQPVPLVTRQDDEPAPYPHLLGARPGKHSLFRDLRNMATDADAAERVQRQLTLAVTTDSLPVTDPPNRDALRVMPRDPENPLTGIVSTGSITDDSPFWIPRYDATDETDLSNPHVQGVEPVLGDVGAWSRSLVTPTAVSGKVALTREAVLSDSSPKMEALVWARMNVARQRAIEVALAAMLDGLTLPGGQVFEISRNGSGAASGASVDDVIDVLSGLTYTTDASRFSRTLLAQGTYGDLINARDSTGRRLLPVLGPTNADGTVNPAGTGFGSVNIGGVTGRPVAGLTNSSYLIDPSVVWQWLGPVLRLEMDYEVAWVRLGHFQFQASAVTDASGIIRLTRASA